MFEQTGGGVDLGTRLARRAESDEVFRGQLRLDPRAVVEKELGRPIDRKGKVALLEDDAPGPYVVLPLAPRRGAEQAAGERQRADGKLELADCAWPPPCMDCVGQGCWDASRSGELR